MPSLSSMRSLDPAGDAMQPLGPPVREVREVPPPAPKPTGTPGVFEMPDEKLATNLPLPPDKPAFQVRVFKDLQALQSPTPEQEVMERALFIAVQDEGYPVDGRRWQAHKPGNTPPNGATWTVLRNGMLRKALGICSWGAGSETDENLHFPDYDVVGWK